MLTHKTETNTNLFLLSLSAADSFMLLLCIPLEMLQLFAVRIKFGDTVCVLGSYFRDLCCAASVLNLSAVSMER